MIKDIGNVELSELFETVEIQLHVTSLFGLIVLPSYDECTALVKSDGASKHVWSVLLVDTVTY